MLTKCEPVASCADPVHNSFCSYGGGTLLIGIGHKTEFVNSLLGSGNRGQGTYRATLWDGWDTIKMTMSEVPMVRHGL